MPLSRCCLVGLILLPGCATLVDGTTQDIAIRTAPMGAVCTLQRGMEDLGTIASTPGHLLVERGKQDLTVICRKPGWETAVIGIKSGFTGVTVGNLVIGGLPGVIVDAASGSDYLYGDTDKIILMTPQVSSRAPEATSLAPTTPTKPASVSPALVESGNMSKIAVSEIEVGLHKDQFSN